jgi:glutathione S-transferase
MTVVLYWMAVSHPSAAARKMLELKQVECKIVPVAPLNQRLHLRLAGFRGGTVPALKLDGRKVQGSREIARALDERWPEPPLFPADPELRVRVEAAERWGDQELQPIPRRLFRFGVANNPELRQWVIRRQRLPAREFVGRVLRLLVGPYTRTIEADGRCANEAGVRADLAVLPSMLDRIDHLLADGTLKLDPPNAAALQILATVRLLDGLEDLHDLVRAHKSAEPSRELFPNYRVKLPRFLDPAWLEPIVAATTR